MNPAGKFPNEPDFRPKENKVVRGCLIALAIAFGLVLLLIGVCFVSIR